MTAKEFLQQFYLVYREIDVKLEQIVRLQSMATRTTSAIRNVPNSGNQIFSRIEYLIAEVQEKILKLEEEISELISVGNKISEAISSVEECEERIILEYRYLCFLTWKEISRSMRISLRHAFSLHERALKKFSKHLQ